MRKKIEELINYLKAKDNLIYALTYEENELIEDICEAARKMKDPSVSYKIPAKIYTYSRTQGGLMHVDIMNPGAYKEERLVPNIMGTSDVFKFIRSTKHKLANKNENFLRNIGKSFGNNNTEKKEEPKEEENIGSNGVIFILKDLHLYFNDKDVLRFLRDLCEYYKANKGETYCHIIITSPILDIPPELEKICTLYEYPLMDLEEMSKYVSGFCKVCNLDAEQSKQVAQSLVGLTAREAFRALMHSMAKYRPENKICIQDLQEAKMQAVKKSGALDFIVPQHTLNDLGGCDNFKLWVKKVKESLSPEAAAFGVPQPKGAMLVGVPGTSKTVSAEILASYLNLPLLSLNIARVMGSFVGQSEHRIIEALRIAKSVAPCVLLLDECEKVLGGQQSSNQSDAGTLSRVMAQILNFLQEDNTGIITMMTSNDVSQLPPELTRSGRIDAQWMFDLPNEFERGEIIDIYIKKHDLILGETERLYMIQSTENFTGAEIKAAVKEILVNVFYRQKEAGVTELTRNVTIEDVQAGTSNVVTVYQSSKEKIDAFRMYASGRYLNASKSVEEIKTSLKKLNVLANGNKAEAKPKKKMLTL